MPSPFVPSSFLLVLLDGVQGLSGCGVLQQQLSACPVIKRSANLISWRKEVETLVSFIHMFYLVFQNLCFPYFQKLFLNLTLHFLKFLRFSMVFEVLEFQVQGLPPDGVQALSGREFCALGFDICLRSCCGSFADNCGDLRRRRIHTKTTVQKIKPWLVKFPSIHSTKTRLGGSLVLPRGGERLKKRLHYPFIKLYIRTVNVAFHNVKKHVKLPARETPYSLSFGI